jgi:hypothetical protein
LIDAEAQPVFTGDFPRRLKFNGTRSDYRRIEMIDSALTQFELRFQSLFDSGRGYSFPCDPEGHVDLNQLSDRARNNYLYARAVVGRELAFPAVRPGGLH